MQLHRTFYCVVKRLYGTFHEPFKRAVPNPVPTAENPIDEHTDAELTTESERSEGEEILEGSKRQKKEADVGVKSAIKAAFAKYSDQIGCKRNTLVLDESKDTNIVDQKADND